MNFKTFNKNKNSTISSALAELSRCSKCILPNTFPDIEFNEEGVCNFCSSYKKVKPKGEDKLRKNLVSSNISESKYDCIVQLSGGKDSTYVLYYAVKKLGLKVLAVNYDSGFQSNIAINNMKRSCEIMNVPLVIHKSNFAKRIKIVSDLIRIGNILKAPMSLCANCSNGIHAASKLAAERYGTTIVLSGQTDFERFPQNPVTGSVYLFKKLANANLFKILPLLIRCRLQIGMERAQWSVSSFIKKCVSFDRSDIKTIYLFDYIPWACMQPKILELLEKEAGWEYPGERVDRFDCVLHPFLCYKWLAETGITWDGYLYSESIRMGAMSREEALTREMHIVEKLKEHCSKLIERPEFNGLELNWF